jgi:hypothetical protein
MQFRSFYRNRWVWAAIWFGIGLLASSLYPIVSRNSDSISMDSQLSVVAQDRAPLSKGVVIKSQHPHINLSSDNIPENPSHERKEHNVILGPTQSRILQVINERGGLQSLGVGVNDSFKPTDSFYTLFGLDDRQKGELAILCDQVLRSLQSWEKANAAEIEEPGKFKSYEIPASPDIAESIKYNFLRSAQPLIDSADYDLFEMIIQPFFNQFTYRRTVTLWPQVRREEGLFYEFEETWEDEQGNISGSSSESGYKSDSVNARWSHFFSDENN